MFEKIRFRKKWNEDALSSWNILGWAVIILILSGVAYAYVPQFKDAVDGIIFGEVGDSLNMEISSVEKYDQNINIIHDVEDGETIDNNYWTNILINIDFDMNEGMWRTINDGSPRVVLYDNYLPVDESPLNVYGESLISGAGLLGFYVVVASGAIILVAGSDGLHTFNELILSWDLGMHIIQVKCYDFITGEQIGITGEFTFEIV